MDGIGKPTIGSSGQSSGMFPHWFHSPTSLGNNSPSLVTWWSSR